MPDQTSNSLSCLPSLINATQYSLTFTPASMLIHQLAENIGLNFSQNEIPWVLEVLIFMSHAAAKSFNLCQRPDAKEASKTKASAKTNQLILHLLIITHISVQLSLSI